MNGRQKKNHPKLPKNNRSYISISDADAKLSEKRGKPSGLYYLSSMAVDTADVLRHPFSIFLLTCKRMEHLAPLADERDSKHLVAIAGKLPGTLKHYGLPLQYLLAGGGFGSGENGPATYGGESTSGCIGSMLF